MISKCSAQWQSSTLTMPPLTKQCSHIFVTTCLLYSIHRRMISIAWHCDWLRSLLLNWLHLTRTKYIQIRSKYLQAAPHGKHLKYNSNEPNLFNINRSTLRGHIIRFMRWMVDSFFLPQHLHLNVVYSVGRLFTTPASVNFLVRTRVCVWQSY